jgi:uncharacterized FlgJ-related protein
MTYKFNPNTLNYEKNNKTLYKYVLLGIGISLLTFIVGRQTSLYNLTKYEKELIVLNLEQEKNKFTEEKLVYLLKELNVRFPHIVMAQALLETGNFKSKVFIQNNNCFGMKQAQVRVNTAKGTSLNHAYYDSWKESVYDYAFYQCRYMSSASSEDEYYAALDASYAEASQYSKTLKGIVEKRGLRKLFR